MTTDGSRYYSLNDYLRQTYGEKLYKLALNGGMSCPNRDGTLGTRGCIFCSAGGSGDFAGNPQTSVHAQIEEQRKRLRQKTDASSYIAYFQAYTNTYAEPARLEQLFTEAIRHPDVKILSIATRPDCLGDEVVALLSRLNQEKPVWVELGLQTIHERSAAFIRRGYPLPVFEAAVEKLRAAGLTVIVHTILYLPGETEQMMLDTIRYLNTLDIQGIKLQLLHVLRGTDLAGLYLEHPFSLPSMEEYIAFLGECVMHLRPDIVIHRLTGDGPKSLLLAPLWSGNKRLVLNQTAKYFREHDIRQGACYRPPDSD